MSETLKRAITDSGMSVTAVAKAAGIPQPVLHRFLTGESGLTLTNAQKLVDYFALELRPRGKK